MRNKSLRPIAKMIIAYTACMGTLLAQQYVYTNDSIQYDRGPNSVTGYLVAPSGVITPIASYLTGGLSANGYWFAQIGIASAKTKDSQCLFVADGYSNDVAGFTISMLDGTLKTAAGSPFASGGLGGGSGLGLAVSYTSGRPLLFAGNTISNTITTFLISRNCTLQAFQTIKVWGPPLGLMATPNGKYLVVSYVRSVGSFRIESNGGLVQVTSPIAANGGGQGIDISCDSSTAYFGTVGNQVVASGISPAGRLRMMNEYLGDSPAFLDNVLLSPDGTTLFVGDAYFPPPSVIALEAGPRGGLKYGSTAALHGGAQAVGMATTQSGDLLFVGEAGNSAIAVLQVDGTTLTEIPGSPFPTTSSGYDSLTVSLVAVPGKSCQ